MAELPIMPLKTDALIADTTHMTAEEFGVYVRLLIAMWRHGGKLPHSPSELAQVGGGSLQKWRGLANVVLRPMTVAGGYVSQKRLTDTMLKVQDIRAKKSRAIKIRWARSKGTNVIQMNYGCNTNQNQTREPSLTSTEQGAEKGPSSKEER